MNNCTVSVHSELCCDQSDNKTRVLQTVRSNILILLQFVSCVAVKTTFMLLQVVRLAEISVTQ